MDLLNDDLNNDLNESQRKAVEYIDGPSLVIAGAGSGKTRVLTYKIAYLLHLKKDLNSLLVLTFTNKAAREMVGRIRKMFGEKFSESQNIWALSIVSLLVYYTKRHLF